MFIYLSPGSVGEMVEGELLRVLLRLDPRQGSARLRRVRAQVSTKYYNVEWFFIFYLVYCV